MGNPGGQRDYEPVCHRLEVFLQSPDVPEIRQAEGLGTGATGNGHQQPDRKNARRFCAGHRADGTALLKKIRLKSIPLPVLLLSRCRTGCRENPLIFQVFLPLDNQNNQKIKEKVNSKPSARQRLFARSLEARCRTSLPTFSCLAIFMYGGKTAYGKNQDGDSCYYGI